MKTTHLIRTTILAGFAAAAISSGAFAQVQAMEYNGITYMTGGIGLEEREALEAQQNNYNLKILSAGLRGHFVGEEIISIRDSKGTEVLNAVGGPVFLANLAPGSYTVTASHNGEPKTQKISVGNGKSSRISFAWAADENDDAAADGSTRAGQMLVAPYNQMAPAPAATAPYPMDQMPEPQGY